MRVIITGGSGLIGRALAQSLSVDGHEIIILTRNPNPEVRLPAGAKQVKWDARTPHDWGELANDAGAIVNLAGEGIADSRWNDERKRRIYESRINAGKAVIEAISATPTKPKVLIQASAVGYYGPRGDELIAEDAGAGSDFLSQVCFDWEASTDAAEQIGVRRVVIRTGIVLSNEGGAWPRIVLPYKFFAGGPIGNGKQYWPWIHIDDQVAAMRYLIDNEQAHGVFNLSAPTPLTNRKFGATLGKVMGRPSLLPVPSFALKILFGEMSTVLLDGQRAVPQRLQALGYAFKYPSADKAFATLI